MSDDVASFFKSKKTKKHGTGHRGGHGAVVQTPDELARRLELTVQQQQALDRENGAEHEEDDEFGYSRPVYSQDAPTGNNTGSGAATAGGQGVNIDDSEWLEVDQEKEIDLAELGIKEMEINEENDALGTADDEVQSNRKTWKVQGAAENVQAGETADPNEKEAAQVVDEKEVPAKEESDATKKEEVKNEEVVAEKATKYVPPSLRMQQLTGSSSRMKKPNLEDAMEFPSLDIASKLEDDLEKAKKKKQMISAASSGLPPPSRAVWGRKATSPPVQSVHDKSDPSPVPASTPASNESSQTQQPPQPNKYVPPHLRNKV